MKLEEMKDAALEMIKNDDDLFCSMIDELDSWNGCADCFRCYDMAELDDLCSGMKISDFLDSLTSSFCHNDEYFYYSVYGFESTDDKAALYRDNVYESDLLEEIIDNYNHLYFWNDEFKELIDAIVNYDGDSEESVTAA